jgi:hypothetical protein
LEAGKTGNTIEYLHNPYMPLNPAFSYYLLPTHPQAYFPTFNYPLNP